ncbi:MAG: hypothetical protein ACNFW9_05550 [Candidatus Kerfeldbacteria bacterium]|jgi:hypothetical protein
MNYYDVPEGEHELLNWHSDGESLVINIPDTTITITREDALGDYTTSSGRPPSLKVDFVGLTNGNNPFVRKDNDGTMTIGAQQMDKTIMLRILRLQSIS